MAKRGALEMEMSVEIEGEIIHPKPFSNFENFPPD
jgi:hypothetical protein